MKQRPSARQGWRPFGRERDLLRAASREALDFLGVAHRHQRRRAPAGSRPEEMVIARDAPPPRVEWVRYSADGCRSSTVEDAQELRAALVTPEIDWINVQGFGDEQQLRAIADIFQIHPLALADMVNVPQRPKVDAYGDQRLIILRMARWVDGRVDLQQVSLVLGPGWLISFEEHAGDVFDPVRERIRRDGTLLRASGVDFLAYALVDAVVDGYFPVLDGLAELLEELEEHAIARPNPRTLGRIHAARRLLILLARVQTQQRDAILALSREGESLFGEAVRPYLRDVLDHAIHVLDMTASLREMTIGIMDIYLSSVGNRTNEAMRTLTIVATIFIPMTFIAGVYGMNFDVMPELHWRWGYLAAWALMVGLAGSLLYWFRRRGWLVDRDPADEQDDPDELGRR